eukprot:GHVR01006959.1.p1 GENE.GHVR01006959.1~~GHVR01006959.1.p1  ORF type:complete len:354 (+),score=66.85 GHVR01006959.1:531-1592(+)
MELNVEVQVQRTHADTLKSQLSEAESRNELLASKVNILQNDNETRNVDDSFPNRFTGVSLELSSAAAMQTLDDLRERNKTLENDNYTLRNTSTDENAKNRIAQLENEIDDLKRAKLRVEHCYQEASTKMMQYQGTSEALTSRTSARNWGDEEIQLMRMKLDVKGTELSELYKSKDELNRILMATKDENLLVRTNIGKLEEKVRSLETLNERLQESVGKNKGTSSESVKLLQVTHEKQELLLKSRITNLEQQLQVKVSQLDDERKRVSGVEASVRHEVDQQHVTLVSTLKQQLQIREAEIGSLKSTQAVLEHAGAEEEHLLSSCFHEIGLRYHELLLRAQSLSAEREHARGKSD